MPTPIPPSTVVAKPARLPTNKPTDPPSMIAKVKPVDDTPKVINDAINQIGDLPPPIK
jgi:hypothetical protein